MAKAYIMMNCDLGEEKEVIISNKINVKSNKSMLTKENNKKLFRKFLQHYFGLLILK